MHGWAAMPEKNQIADTQAKTAIKICGLSTREAVDAAVANGATHIGLVHFKKSPRHISLKEAAALRDYIAGRVQTVLLTVNNSPAEIGRAIKTVRPDIIQFHGTETPEWFRLLRQHSDVGIWKALGVRDAETLEKSVRYADTADMLLFDAPAQALPGGTGTSFDWALLRDFNHQIAWGLAGGLDPDNVADAMVATGAPLVDVSSGVESAPGVKDVAKIAAFCQAVQQYDESRTHSK